jgi:hypothetical protein
MQPRIIAAHGLLFGKASPCLQLAGGRLAPLALRGGKGEAMQPNPAGGFRTVENLKKLTLAAAGMSALLFLPAAATRAAPDDNQALIAMGLCSQMEPLINTLIDYSYTKCLPNITGAKGTTFIFITEKPVFAVEASKKAWIIVVVAAVGKTLNEKPSYRADAILLADVSMAKDKSYYTISAALAKSLQHKVYSGQISAEAMWGQISSALSPYAAPPNVKR